MKVGLIHDVFDAVEWQPEMDPTTGMPRWGSAAYGVHQASNDMGVVGLIAIRGQPQQIHPGYMLILASSGEVLEALKPVEFKAKYEEIVVKAPIETKGLVEQPKVEPVFGEEKGKKGK